ncbi:SecD/SecF fusion protein [Scopulibacillus daqui]|uniref:Protein-export membrane protein SecF n=1 Tax=Scopulibacillus daqui TaxID=1469162 RepID=A0ABS2PXW5_9BACL|nr:SecD/SecF fusion protein [Scopulibacillus daqui]
MSLKKFDFIKHRNKFFVLSIAIVIIGIISLFVFRLNLGIDFSSGTRVDIMGNKPLSINQIEQKFKELGYNPERPVLSGNKHNIATVRINKDLNQNEVAKIKDTFKKELGIDPNVSTVSPQVGRDMAKNAFWAVVIASIAMIIYITIRFEFLQGLAAIIALLHDAFFIVTIFSLFHLEVNVEFIAAVLTIIGYSINDTIVTFDRIRENIKRSEKKPKTFMEYGEIVNRSIRQTLVRSINTVVTVLLPVIALLIFGSESIRNFTIALFVGLIAGVYSSIFIASPLWAVWKSSYLKRKRKKAAQPQA